MSIIKNINAKAQAEANSGYSKNSNSGAGRLINKDGTPNLKKKGLSFMERFSMYHTMLQIKGWKFILLIVMAYTVANLFFASVYYLVGVEHLAGASVNGDSPLDQFLEAFFFSAQTFTTVGYGRVSPLGFWTSAIATIEALFGLMTLAIVTSLFYGRFARPKAFIKFSNNALIAPYEDGEALMLRMAPYKNNYLLDAQVKVSVNMRNYENGKQVNSFYNLDLEISRINALPLSWTVVHPIDERSPFFNFKPEDYDALDVEILVYLTAFDDLFSNTVVARNSYTAQEIKYGMKFSSMFYPSEQRTHTILDLSKLNDMEPAPIGTLESAV